MRSQLFLRSSLDMIDEDTSKPTTLRAFRTAAGYSQLKLGEQIGVSPSAVKFWEMGKREPTIGNVAALARTFNVSFKTICKSIQIDISGIPDDCEGVEDEGEGEKTIHLQSNQDLGV